VEKEHITNCGSFQAVEKYEMPYDNKDESLASARTTILEKSDELEKPFLENGEIFEVKKKIREKKNMFEKRRSLTDLKKKIEDFEEEIKGFNGQKREEV